MKLLTRLLILATLVAPAACKDAGAPDGDPPAMLSDATFVADFSNFQNSPSPVAALSGAAPAAGSNWIYSAVVVGFWNTALAVTLVAPVAAFRAAIGQTPTGENGAWVWRYNFNIGTAQHSARLEARPATGGIDWDMYMSKSGEYTDFHWYEGFSRLDATSGTWTLQRAPNQDVKFIDIAWTRNAALSTGDIKYTNVTPGSAENGSYILQATTPSISYNSFMELGSASTSNVTRIEWNRASKVGRVRDPANFGDSNWHCWDVNLNNVAC